MYTTNIEEVTTKQESHVFVLENDRCEQHLSPKTSQVRSTKIPENTVLM